MVISDSELSSIQVKAVFTHHSCLLKDTLKLACHLVDLEVMHVGGVSRNNKPVLHIFCILRVAPWVILDSLICTLY
jgi:hypothetical protein